MGAFGIIYAVGTLGEKYWPGPGALGFVEGVCTLLTMFVLVALLGITWQQV
jgi:hypothetical protein